MNNVSEYDIWWSILLRAMDGYISIISGFAPFSIGRTHFFLSFAFSYYCFNWFRKSTWWIDSYIICCIWNTFFNIHHCIHWLSTISLKQVENLYIPSFQKLDISIESLSSFSKFKQFSPIWGKLLWFLRFSKGQSTLWISTVSGMVVYRWLLIDLHTKNYFRFLSFHSFHVVARVYKFYSQS